MDKIDAPRENSNNELSRCLERLESVPDWIWEVDTQGRFTYTNAAPEEMVGYSPAEILAMTSFDLVVPDQAEAVRERFRNSVRTRHAIRDFIVDVRTKDGAARTLAINTSLMLDAQGRLTGLRGVARDVTHQQQLTMAAEEVQENYRRVVENSPTGIIVVQDGRIVYGNPAIVELMGYSLEEAIGMEAWQFIHPDDRERVREYYTERMAGRPAPAGYEVRALTKSGETRLFELRATAINYNGKPAVLDTVIDITERMRAEREIAESEANYRTLIETLNEGFAEADGDYNFTYVNQRFPEMLGYTREEMMGRNIMDFLDDENKAVAREQAARRRKGLHSSYELAWTARDGEKVSTLISPRPRFSEDGRFIGSFAVLTDLTHLKQAEQTLRENESLLRSIFDAIQDGISVSDTELSVIRANRAMQEMYRYREGLCGRKCYEVYRGTAQICEACPSVRAMETKSLQMALAPLYGSEGGTVGWLELYAYPLLDEHGEVKGVVEHVRNVTERVKAEKALRDSEERYRLLFEQSPDMVFLMKGQLFVDVNPAVRRIFGYEADEVVGHAPWEISPDIQPDGRCSREKAAELIEAAERGPLGTFDWVHIRKDGSLADCEVSLSNYEVHGERFIQAIVRDVTERKRAEDRRREFERGVEDQKRQFYRETILSVTGGKLDICDSPQVRPFVRSAMDRIEIRGASELAAVRHKVGGFCRDNGLDGDRLYWFMIGVGEAVTNAVKHGGQGRVYVGVGDGSVWVGVADKGRGIESLILPRATLLRGFSTKPSLGLGYSVMLEVADRVLLKTDQRGTVVVLIKNLVEPEVRVTADSLPDTWEGIPG